MKSIRSELHAMRSENEKAPSPTIVRSLGRMYREVEAERRPVRVATSCTVSLVLAVHDVQWQVWTRCITKHNLNWILDSIGSQCSSRRPSEMLSRGRRFNTIRAATFWTRWRVTIIDFGSCFWGRAIQWDQCKCCTIKQEVRSPKMVAS